MDEETDFHPDEEPAKEFTYSAYFQNLRHTLNIMTKKPVKKKLSSRCEKLLIQVFKPDSGKDQTQFAGVVEKIGRSYAHKAKILNLDAEKWEESDYLLQELNAIQTNRNVAKRPNIKAIEKYGLVKFHKQCAS